MKWKVYWADRILCFNFFNSCKQYNIASKLFSRLARNIHGETSGLSAFIVHDVSARTSLPPSFRKVKFRSGDVTRKRLINAFAGLVSPRTFLQSQRRESLRSRIQQVSCKANKISV